MAFGAQHGLARSMVWRAAEVSACASHHAARTAPAIAFDERVDALAEEPGGQHADTEILNSDITVSVSSLL